MSIKLNTLNSREVLNYIALSLLIIAILGALEGTFFLFSLNYIVYENLVSWYFPVGLNLVSFILLPFRYWPAVLLGQAFGQIAFSHLYYDFELTKLWSILYTDWIDKLLLLLPLIYIKYRRIPLEIDRFKGLILILGVTLFYRGARSLYLILDPRTDVFYRDISEPMFSQIIVSHILGGFVGIILALMVAYLGIWIWRNYNKLEWPKLLQFILSLMVLMLVPYSIYQFQPEVMYLLRMIGVLAFIWFAYKFGWIGVIGAALGLNSLILIAAYGVNDTAIMLENQTILTTYGLTALLLGALVNEYNLIKLQLIDNNQLLTLNNIKLLSLKKNIQQLSEKVIEVQEKERKTFSQTLHDELGQNIAALKIGLQIMQSSTSDGIDIVNQSVNEIHSSVYDLMNWVRPSILEDGLFATLESHYFRERLKNANIKYQINLSGNSETLSEVLKISIFRIIQEAVTNSIKYSQAEHFSIDLIIEKKNILLKIKDDGIGSQIHRLEELTGGFGLTGIKERVFTLSGNIELITDNGFYIAIEIPIHSKNALN